MKNEFTYNVFFKKDGCTLQEIMENVLLNYVKNLINNGNCNMESLYV